MAHDGSFAQPPVEFPLSGPPVCVSFGHPTNPGCVRSVQDDRSVANFIELSSVVHRAITPAEKFYLEPSRQHEGLLHVRCCDGSKYWAAQQLVRDSTNPWFIGTVNEPEEDLTKPSCTLFSISHDRTRHIDGCFFRLLHSQQKKYACTSSVSGPGTNYLQLRDDQEDDSSNMNVFIVRRLSQQKELPKYIAFKGDNGKYLTPVHKVVMYPEMDLPSIEEVGEEVSEADRVPLIHVDAWFLQYSLSDISDPGVVHETSTDEYGVVRIRHNASGMFWSCGYGGCIVTVYDGSDSDIPEDTIYNYKDVNTLFKVAIKDGSNDIALQNLGSGKFCKFSKCETIDNTAICDILASSSVDSNTKEATLQVEEPVRSREIYDVQYRVGGAKMSTNKNVSRTQVLATNRTHETHEAQTTIELYNKKENTWNASLSLDLGIKANILASLPFLGGIEGHFNFHGEYKWGETKVEETKRSTLYSYPVPPMTKVTCSIFAREDVVDVPFSYTQKDVLFSGEVIPPREIHGGVYRGVDSTDIDIDTHEEKIEG